MKWHDFLFNGQYASQLGVVVEDQPTYIRPARRVNEVSIPGRDGMVSLLGDDGYEPVIYSPRCVLLPGKPAEPVWNWLRGSGWLTLGSMPTYSYQARLSNQIPFQALFQGSGESGMTFTPVFVCQPHRYAATGSSVEAFTAPEGWITNQGNVPSAPLIRIWGSGSAWFALGGHAVALSDLELDQPLVIDSDICNVYDQTMGKLLNSRMDGPFPMLQPGPNLVNWSGIAGSIQRVEIDPRSRWI